MHRLLFEKTGNAVWISHLDLMRVFQRAFKRAGLNLTHTKGFNPRPSVSIALPMSVGIESICELLDFDLDGYEGEIGDLAPMLNEKLIPGIRVLSAYSDGSKIRNLAYMDCCLTLTYDSGIPEGTVRAIKDLFSAPEVLVEKKGKNGISEQNIAPMILSLEAAAQTDKHLEITCRICCQNPTLNPLMIHGAITRYLPEYAPSFVRCKRIEIYDTTHTIFR